MILRETQSEISLNFASAWRNISKHIIGKTISLSMQPPQKKRFPAGQTSGKMKDMCNKAAFCQMTGSSLQNEPFDVCPRNKLTRYNKIYKCQGISCIVAWYLRERTHRKRLKWYTRKWFHTFNVYKLENIQRHRIEPFSLEQHRLIDFPCHPTARWIPIPFRVRSLSVKSMPTNRYVVSRLSGPTTLTSCLPG